jgi:hypothetical protein
VHSLVGNGGPTGKGAKGSGEGKGKNTVVEQDPEVEFAKSMKEAIPEAARLRFQPRRLQSEWEQEIKHHQHLDATGGVAICPREALPAVLARVGYTSRACAVLVVQGPDTLHLQGYPGTKVRCTFDVCAQVAERNQVTVERYLVQLGFADQVQLRQEGDEVKVGVTMCKIDGQML